MFVKFLSVVIVVVLGLCITTVGTTSTGDKFTDFIRLKNQPSINALPKRYRLVATSIEDGSAQGTITISFQIAASARTESDAKTDQDHVMLLVEAIQIITQRKESPKQEFKMEPVLVKIQSGSLIYLNPKTQQPMAITPDQQAFLHWILGSLMLHLESKNNEQSLVEVTSPSNRMSFDRGRLANGKGNTIALELIPPVQSSSPMQPSIPPYVGIVEFSSETGWITHANIHRDVVIAKRNFTLVLEIAELTTGNEANNESEATPARTSEPSTKNR
ncbi:MAG: hypothetical protein WC058_02155 [Phycisphaeraceae bacterium]